MHPVQQHHGGSDDLTFTSACVGEGVTFVFETYWLYWDAICNHVTRDLYDINMYISTCMVFGI